MGLDGVELVLATEDEFKIVIDDADVSNITTPRMLADYVISRLSKSGGADGRCMLQASFYRLRSALVKQFGALRTDVRLDSPIRQFLKGDIRTQWRQLGIAIEAAQLPELKCKKHIYYLITIGIPFGLALLPTGLGSPIWSAALAFLLLWLIAGIVAGRMADQIPPALTTVGSIVPYVGISNPEEWSHEYVLKRVLQITSLQLGIPVEKIHPDHHFVEDLGLD